MLVVKDLSKSYQNKSVVRNVSFNVNPGERLILLGTSGSGKSTILKMINRLVEKDSGLIKFEGEDVSSIEPHILRRRIGYVIQNIGLFPHYSVEKNIGLIPALLNWPLIDKDKRIDELIALVGLDTTFKERMPHELSGGQQQRVGIARALAVDPKLLLMDEPFGALDPITRKEIQEEFVSLNNDQTAVVLVTHDVKEAFLLGDKICLLDQGKIQQLGAPKELLFHPANEFVENFLSDHFIELELSLICMHHLAPFIDRSQPDALTEKIDPTMPISKAMRYASEITFEHENQLLTIHPNQIASLYFNNQNQIRPLL